MNQSLLCAAPYLAWNGDELQFLSEQWTVKFELWLSNDFSTWLEYNDDARNRVRTPVTPTKICLGIVVVPLTIFAMLMAIQSFVRKFKCAPKMVSAAAPPRRIRTILWLLWAGIGISASECEFMAPHSKNFAALASHITDS